MAFDRMFKRGALAGAVLLVASAAIPAAAADKLQYFTWSGYELSDFNKSFLAAHSSFPIPHS